MSPYGRPKVAQQPSFAKLVVFLAQAENPLITLARVPNRVLTLSLGAQQQLTSNQPVGHHSPCHLVDTSR